MTAILTGHRKQACCAETCHDGDDPGEYCPCCCGNVLSIASSVTIAVVRKWDNTGLTGGTAGSVSFSFTASNNLPNYDTNLEECLPGTTHTPCSYAWNYLGRDCGPEECGDVTWTEEIPDGLGGVAMQPMCLTVASFFCQCKAAEDICDGTAEPNLYQTGVSQRCVPQSPVTGNYAGWRGELNWQACSPGDDPPCPPTALLFSDEYGRYACAEDGNPTKRVFGPHWPCNGAVCCQDDGCIGEEPEPGDCPNCSCCPLEMTYVLGAFIFDPDGASVGYTHGIPDFINCTGTDYNDGYGVVPANSHRRDNTIYANSTLSTVTISASADCFSYHDILDSPAPMMAGGKRPRGLTTPQPTPPKGPGTELTRMLAAVGVKSCQRCKEDAALMNRNGSAWCREHAQWLAGRIQARADKLGWWAKLTVGGKLAAKGLPLTVTGLVLEAVRRVEVNEKTPP